MNLHHFSLWGIRRSLALVVLVAATSNGYAGVAAQVDSFSDFGVSLKFGNFIAPKGTYSLTADGGDTATLTLIEVKLQKLVDGAYQDYKAFQKCNADSGLWSAAQWFNLPAGDYRVFVRMHWDQVVGGMEMKDKTLDNTQTISFK
ncbi:MAG: hypothetical protein U0793_07740 [Gemmataceae bacterium]